MSDKQAIKHLHSLLKHKDRWYIEPSVSDIDEINDICQTAMENANYELPRLSANALYQRYERWRKSEPFLGADEDLFHAFLDQVCFDLGLASLLKEEKALFEGNCFLNVKFI